MSVSLYNNFATLIVFPYYYEPAEPQFKTPMRNFITVIATSLFPHCLCQTRALSHEKKLIYGKIIKSLETKFIILQG